MSSILDVAATPAQRGTSGPVQYRALRDTLTDHLLDPEHVHQLQLVERIGDSERFVLVTRETHPTVALVERVNARNVRRSELDAALKDIDATLEGVDVDDADALTPAQVNALADRDALTAERKALPKIDALRSAPVARALMTYAEEDAEQAAAADTDTEAGA